MGEALHYLRDHRPMPAALAAQLQHQVEAVAAVSAEEKAAILAIHEAGRHDDLDERAARLWPDDAPHAVHNRAEWKRAVRLVRETKRGWVCDVEVIHG